jgi:hypothetical protein
MTPRNSAVAALVLASIGGWSRSAEAADVPADPSDYQALLGALQPGDRLVLAPGTYTRLTIDGIHGEPDAWITVTGPTEGDPAVVVGESCCNTVQLYDSSYVAITNLVIDAQGLYVDAVNAKDTPSHDILIEGNTMQGFPQDEQQIVGVNTKTTVWNWTIRGNTILEAGTGIYLGGSEGDTPFIAGVIENNLVLNPMGYCMQVKHQNDYAAGPDMPAGPNRTIIRNNVFIKDDRESLDGDRPNLLVGGFPDAGTGAEDTYHIYGNLLFYNPREALLQATGRVSVHDNIFVGAGASFPAIAVTGHQGKSVELAYVYDNTVFTGGTGISFAEAASQDDAVVGNLVFAPTPIAGPIADLRDNIVATEAEAPEFVAMPAVMLGAMDFYPLPGTVVGAPIDMAKFEGDPDFDRDYNGTARGEFTFRGAYAGEGENPGCPLDAEIKDCGPAGTDEGGSDEDGSDGSLDDGDDSGDGSASAGTTDADGSASADGATIDTGAATDGAADGEDATESGCGCASASPSSSVALLGWITLLAGCWARRGGRRRGPGRTRGDRGSRSPRRRGIRTTTPRFLCRR